MFRRAQAVFLSYSREDREFALDLAQAIRNGGDRVFIDVADIETGEDHHKIIRESIEKADKFVFVATQHSVAQGSYTHSEIKFASEKWPSPVGRAYTVIIDSKISENQIDSYLRSVNMFRASGNAIAELIPELQKNKPLNILRLTLCFFSAILLFASVLLLWAKYWEHPDQTLNEIVHLSPKVSLGNYLGLATVLVRISFTGQGDESISVTLSDLLLFPPDGGNKQLFLAAMLIGSEERPVLPLITVSPGDTFYFDYEYGEISEETNQLLQKVFRDSFDKVSKMARPEQGTLGSDTVAEFEKLFNRQFSWIVGRWKLQLNYSVRRPAAAPIEMFETIEIDILQSDIDTMKSWVKEYETGSGIFPAWRRVNPSGTPQLIFKSLHH